MPRTRRRFIKYAIILPSLSFAASACSPSNSTNIAASSKIDVQPKASKTVEPIPLRVAYPSGMNGQIAMAMEKAEIAKRHNLDATFKFFQYGPPMMEALSANNVDTAIVGLTAAINYMARNPGKATLVAYLGNSTYSLMVPKNSAIADLQDLRNKRIAVSFGSDSHVDLLKLLDELNLDTKTDVKLLNTPPNELQMAFEQDFADAAIIRQPQTLKMQEKFGSRIMKTWPSRFVALVQSDYLEKHPEAKELYVQSLQESIFYIAANKEQVSEWFSEQIRTEPEIIRKVSLDDPNYKAKRLEDISVELTEPVKKMIEEWGALSYQYGVIKGRVDWNW